MQSYKELLLKFVFIYFDMFLLFSLHNLSARGRANDDNSDFFLRDSFV